MTAPAGPVPTSRIVTVRRHRPLRAGALALVVGIVAVAIGFVVLAGQQALQVAAAKGRARVGNDIAFVAEDADYAIILIPDPPQRTFAEDRIAQLGCQVRHPDGEVEELDPASQASRSSSVTGVLADDFRGRPGRTTVRCRWEGPSALGGSYSVGRANLGVRMVGIIAVAAGTLVATLGVVGIVVGLRGRPERQPIGA